MLFSCRSVFFQCNFQIPSGPLEGLHSCRERPVKLFGQWSEGGLLLSCALASTVTWARSKLRLSAVTAAGGALTTQMMVM